MLTIIGLATVALTILAVLAAFGKVDLDKDFSAFGYSVEFQANEKVPLGIMISKG